MTPSRADETDTDPILARGAELFADLQSANVSVNRIEEWQRWLAQDEANRAAYDSLESLWLAIDDLEDAGEAPAPDACARDEYDGAVSVEVWRRKIAAAERPPEAPRAPARRWSALWNQHFALARIGLTAALILFALIVFPKWPALDGASSTIVIETRAGENRDVTLADGSQLTVGGRTLLWATLSRHSRTVIMERGEAFFHVAKDRRRPFTVRSLNTEITAVGTAFDVRQAAGIVVVGVAEGVVNVEASAATSATTPEGPLRQLATLRAGREISVDRSGQIRGVGNIDARSVAGWRQGLLWYMNEPLEAVVADLSRYTRREIRIADARVGQLRVTGTLRAGGEESWLKSLEFSLPVAVVTNSDGSVQIDARLPHSQRDE